MIAPRSHRHLLVRGGTLVTMDPRRRVVRGDVLVTDGRITAVGQGFEVPPATRLLEAEGKVVLPGLVQGHVHLGQTLFRGLAEERPLLPWLRDRIWPLEAAHTAESAYWSGMLGAADCLLSGTTTVQDIGLVHHMEALFRAFEDSGIRAVAGKCLMDRGEGAPPGLLEPCRDALGEAESLVREWEGRGRGRIRTAICPRFVLSCSPELWAGAAELCRSLGHPLHTHLLESMEEEAGVRDILGTGQMEFLDREGILDLDLRVAHGVLLDEPRTAILGERSLKVIHCPSANAKLGSGIADLLYLRDHPRIALGIGCDGAACNNDLDVLEEIRLAALLQDLRHGPGRFGALAALELATIEGARALGLDSELGSLEAGKAGDLVVLDLDRPESLAASPATVYSRIVYGAGRAAVRWVVVDGEILVDQGELVHQEQARLIARAGEEAESLARRAALD